MSTEILTYILKVAMLTVAFVLLFHLLLRKDTFHRVSRIVLVLSLVIVYILPLCRMTRHIEVKAPTFVVEKMASQEERTIPVKTHPITIESAVVDVVEQSHSNVLTEPTNQWFINRMLILLVAYLAGALFLLSRISVSIFRVHSIIKRCTIVSKTSDLTVLVSDDNIRAFSWMSYVVLPAGERNNKAILEHEKAHVKFHHSFELLLVDLLSLLQWFNPAVWMLRRDLCSLHEFEADADVLASGFDTDTYQNVLIGFASASVSIPYTNNFHSSSLRDRISMINRLSSKRVALLKLAYLPLVIFVWMVSTAMTVYVEKPDTDEKYTLSTETEIKQQSVDIVTKPDESDTSNADIMPSSVSTIIEQIKKMDNDQLRSMIRKNQEEMRKPIESVPKAGDRVNGHILDIDGNPIQNREVRVCERDIVNRAITICGASDEDGFFNLNSIRNPENHLTFEAEGFEPQTCAIDRGTYEIRLRPVPGTLKPGDVIKGSVTCWRFTGFMRGGYPSTGALVAEVDKNGNTVSSTIVEDRSFSLKIVNPGNMLVVSMDGYETFRTPIEISNYIIGLKKIE